MASHLQHRLPFTPSWTNLAPLYSLYPKKQLVRLEHRHAGEWKLKQLHGEAWVEPAPPSEIKRRLFSGERSVSPSSDIVRSAARSTCYNDTLFGKSRRLKSSLRRCNKCGSHTLLCGAIRVFPGERGGRNRKQEIDRLWSPQHTNCSCSRWGWLEVECFSC